MYLEIWMFSELFYVNNVTLTLMRNSSSKKSINTRMPTATSEHEKQLQ